MSNLLLSACILGIALSIPAGKYSCVLRQTQNLVLAKRRVTRSSVAMSTLINAGTCSSEEQLQVSIDEDYTAPGGFYLKPPYYRAASSLALTCKVAGLQGNLTYNWNSDCSGGCFTQGKSTQSVEKLALQSTDSGFHTCTVTDPGGCTGNATVEIKVTGEWK